MEPQTGFGSILGGSQPFVASEEPPTSPWLTSAYHRSCPNLRKAGSNRLDYLPSECFQFLGRARNTKVELNLIHIIAYDISQAICYSIGQKVIVVVAYSIVRRPHEILSFNQKSSARTFIDIERLRLGRVSVDDVQTYAALTRRLLVSLINCFEYQSPLSELTYRYSDH